MDLSFGKIVLYIATILALWSAYNHWSTRIRYISHPEGILVAEKPLQKDLDDADIFLHNASAYTPLAEFELKARVLSAKWYENDKESRWSPLDLALGWGPMSNEAVLRDIDIQQQGRFYYWSTPHYPIPRHEIIENSANMHLIPADDTVLENMEGVRIGDIIQLRGYLVNVVDTKDGYFWRTSLTRKDSGAGACELIWVEDFEIITDSI